MEKIIVIIGRLLLSALFLTSAIGKLISPDAFFQFLEATGITAEFLLNILLVVSLVIEFSLAVLLLSKKLFPGAILASVILFLLFAVILIIASNITAGTNVNCGCFGSIFKNSIDQEILFNIIFLAGSSYIYVVWKKNDGVKA